MFAAAQLARETLAKGLRLNAPEAVALVCDEMHRPVAAGADLGRGRRGRAGAGRASDPVSTAWPSIVPEIRLEVLLDEGTRLDRAP